MIVIPALHPAREIVVRVASLRPGDVHRATAGLETVGGKPVNVARFVTLMGGPCRLIACVDPALRAAILADPSLGPSPAALDLVDSTTPSRTDLAIVDDRGETTPINGTAARIPPAELETVVARTLADLAPGDVLVLAGSQPPGAEGVLGRLVAEARRRGAVAVVDASGPWLRDALSERPRVVKINRAEAAGIDLADVPVLAITDGAVGIAVRVDGAAWRISPPRGMEVVNTLGAGDAVTAGLALGLAAGRPPLDAIRLGAAMAAARLRHFEPVLDPSDVPAIDAALRVEPSD